MIPSHPSVYGIMVPSQPSVFGIMVPLTTICVWHPGSGSFTKSSYFPRCSVTPPPHSV
jgi:hypothetical protein